MLPLQRFLPSVHLSHRRRLRRADSRYTFKIKGVRAKRRMQILPIKVTDHDLLKWMHGWRRGCEPHCYIISKNCSIVSDELQYFQVFMHYKCDLWSDCSFSSRQVPVRISALSRLGINANRDRGFVLLNTYAVSISPALVTQPPNPTV